MDVAPTPAQPDQMRALVRHAMDEGALGLGSALIYVPGCFATTDERIALSAAVAEYGAVTASARTTRRLPGDFLPATGTEPAAFLPSAPKTLPPSWCRWCMKVVASASPETS